MERSACTIGCIPELSRHCGELIRAALKAWL